MSFQGLAYFLFLSAAWITARVARPAAVRQAALLAFSYAFYWSWSPPFLLLLVAASLVNFGWGRLLHRRAATRWLWAAVGSNIFLLFSFKYLPPLLLNGGDGWRWELAAPVGISFYTFQAISYLVDVYRGYKDRPTVLEFALYLAFWPTLLSGPICRLPEMLPQFRSQLPPGGRDAAAGLQRIILGLFLKVVLADSLALGLEGHPGTQQSFLDFSGNAGDVWLLCVGYGFQVFFDFAGYSHIAIGSARLFGIRLRENFKAPFMAATISDFWTRWHMSLSSWIRDYLFFPLATRRGSLMWRHLSLVVSMVAFGAWHGPRLSFALWGLYHGFLLVTHRLFQRWRRAAPQLSLPAALAAGFSWVATFAGVTLGWILFASSGLQEAATMARSLFDFSNPSVLDSVLAGTIITLALLYFGVEVGRRLLSSWLGPDRWDRLVWFARPAYLATMLLLIVLWSDRSSPFVYVRF